ncbi:MAG: Crp/Fnr family transcriptional regulator [Chloroflexi bacterium]|nr:Crp/Fnr family transcriptional regulator [Chloroflexota bacterium]
MVDLPRFLKAIPYFASLDTKSIEDMRSHIWEKNFEKNMIIFLEGDPCLGLYLVGSGKVKIYKASPDGRQRVLTTVGPGGTFNDVPIFDQGLNPATAEAVERTVVYIIPKDYIIDIIRRRPEVALVILRLMAGRLRMLTLSLEELSFKDVTSRIARVLLETAEEEGVATKGGVTMGRTVSLHELAAMVGTVREVASRSLRRLEEEGLIRVERHRIIIINKEALQALI